MALAEMASRDFRNGAGSLAFHTRSVVPTHTAMTTRTSPGITSSANCRLPDVAANTAFVIVLAVIANRIGSVTSLELILLAAAIDATAMVGEWASAKPAAAVAKSNPAEPSHWLMAAEMRRMPVTTVANITALVRLKARPRSGAASFEPCALLHVNSRP